jgi:hypothetical protein
VVTNLSVYSSCSCLCSFFFWGKIFGFDIDRKCLLGHRKKLAKCLMRTFTCRSTSSMLSGDGREVVCWVCAVAVRNQRRPTRRLLSCSQPACSPLCRRRHFCFRRSCRQRFKPHPLWCRLHKVKLSYLIKVVFS